MLQIFKSLAQVDFSVYTLSHTRFPNTLYKMLSNLNVISKIEPELLSLKVHLKHFLCLHEAEF